MSEELEKLFQRTYELLRKIKGEALCGAEFLAIAKEMEDKPEDEDEE